MDCKLSVRFSNKALVGMIMFVPCGLIIMYYLVFHDKNSMVAIQDVLSFFILFVWSEIAE